MIWRLLPLLALLAVVGAGAWFFMVTLPMIRRREARKARQDARREALEDYQQRSALEDLDRTRERINSDQDGYYTDRARTLNDPPA